MNNTTMKTKHEIIEESVAYIKENGRGAKLNTELGDPHQECVYHNTETGVMCLVGRCMTHPQEADREVVGSIYDYTCALKDDAEFVNQCTDSVYDEEGCLIALEEKLKPEYRGHEVSFWIDLQEFHDISSYWCGKEMSSHGKNFLSQIKRRWA